MYGEKGSGVWMERRVQEQIWREGFRSRDVEKRSGVGMERRVLEY